MERRDECGIWRFGGLQREKGLGGCGDRWRRMGLKILCAAMDGDHWCVEVQWIRDLRGHIILIKHRII